MRALLLLLLLATTGCYPGSYHGHSSGWQYHGRYQHRTIQGSRRAAPPTLTPLEAVRKGRIEGERRLQQNLDRMHRR
jgi:hypothetical protein